MPCVLCDGSAATQQQRYEICRQQAQRYVNEKETTVIIYQDATTGYGFCEVESFYQQQPGRPIERIEYVQGL